MYKKILKLNNIMVEIGLHWTHELELAPDHKDVELEFVLKWQEEELNSLQFHSVKTNNKYIKSHIDFALAQHSSNKSN